MFLHPYAGAPPARAELEERLTLADGGYTYIVATAALERHREWAAPPAQRVSQPEGETALLVFHKVLRHLMDRAFLTRTEERVMLQRAIPFVEPDPVRAGVLRHDGAAWRDALATLAEQGVDLNAEWDGWRDRFVSGYVGQALRALQTETRRMAEEAGRQGFEHAARRFLLDEYQPAPRIIMEGFTFLRPLQRLLIAVAAERGAEVHLIYPWRPEQARGFALLDRTYAGYAPQAAVVPLGTGYGEPPTALGVLRESLFAADACPAASAEHAAHPSLTLTRYAHPNREAEGLVRRIQAVLNAGVPAHDIAVVSRNAREFDALLQEQAELHRLRDAQGADVAFSIPPRQLLLTPVGRFVLTLYEIWRDGTLQMDAEAFESILASGWLGAHVQETTEPFNAVRAQVFARAHTRDEWLDAMETVRALLRDAMHHPRLPAGSLDEQTVALWLQTLDQVAEVCRRLFSAPDQSIGRHVSMLLEELDRLAPEQMRQAEREILQRVSVVLNDVAESSSLPLNADEFGQVLNGLVREYARPVEEDPDADPVDPTRIWVTTPEGIDGYGKPVVFFVGADNHRAPRAYPEPWPLEGPRVEEHLERERYMFLAVVRATGTALHLSYAAADERRTYLPSPFLQRIVESLGLAITEAEPAPPADAREEPAPEHPRARARRRRYLLSDIAHFSLCPFRYKLERMDPRARNYRSDFQLRFVAQGVWLRLALTHLLEGGRSGSTVSEVKAMFMEAMQATAVRARHMFPGLGRIAWYEVERHVRAKLLNEAEQHRDAYRKRVAPAVPAPIVLPGDRVVTVDASLRFAIQRGRFPQFYDTDLMSQEWLRPPPRPEDGTDRQVVVDGVQVFATSYHAAQWWADAARRAFRYATREGTDWRADTEARFAALQDEVREFVAAIEEGVFPKNPGPHCGFCPVRAECLGLPERRES